VETRNLLRCKRAAGLAAGVVIIAAIVAGPSVSAAAVPPAGRPIIAVAEFYSPGAMPLSVLSDTERYAADALTGLLVQSGGDAVTVLPRSEVATQERALRWVPQDALSYSRLEALAQALRADRLMLGWISRVSVYRVQFLLFNADAQLNMQMFDAHAGRIVWQHETLGSATGGVPDFAAQIAIERGLANGLRAAVAAASAPVDRSAPAP
jgi:hypothetical protein